MRVFIWALLSIFPATAFAGGARYTTVIQESVDGKRAAGSIVELALSRELLAAGIKLVDEEQSRKIRSVTDAGSVVAGAVPAVITTLDADVIVFGVAKLVRVKSEMLGDHAARYDAEIDAKVIAVDTGEVLGVFSVRDHALDYRAERAMKTAADKAGSTLAKEVLAKVPRDVAGSTIELAISGVPDVSVADRIGAAIKRLPDVKEVHTLQAGREMMKLEVETRGAPARQLALAIGGAPDAGLSVFGYTSRAIKAEFSPARASKFPVIVTELRGPKGSWDGVALARILRTALANVESLQPAEQIVRAAPAKAGAAVLTGSYRAVGVDLVVEARVAPFVEKQAVCKKERLAACVAELGDAIAKELPAKLFAKKDAAPAPELGSKPLVVSGVELEDIFPARAASYVDRAIGRVRLENRSAEPVRGLVLSASVPGLTRAPLDTPLADLAPGASAEAPVKIVLDRELLAKEDENRPAVLVLQLAYDAGGFRVEQSSSRAVLVWDKNAMSWKDELSIGAFVTAKDPAVVRIAKAAHGAISGDDPLALPIAVFSAIASLRYSPDPAHPYGGKDVDYVQFPAQTLAVGGGDCDDLAVLYAAIAAAIDLPVLLVTTPGHVFVAADTGLFAHNAGAVSPKPERTLIHDGRVFVPIETTRVGQGRSFADAWEYGAKQLAAAKTAPGVIELGAAWAKYPPSSLGGVEVLAAPDVGPRIATELAAVQRMRLIEMEKAIAEVDVRLKKDRGAALNAKGVLLAAAGRYPEAEAMFDEALGDSKSALGALNNLGNVKLIRGGAKDALANYARALELDPRSAKIHLNAAIAAWVAGDEAAFGERIASALELGAEREVTALAEGGFSRIATDPRGDADAPARARMRELVDKARKRAPDATRASEAGGAAGAVTRFVYWL